MTPPAYWTLLPFLLLLGAIALMPLVRAVAGWWENNLHRFYVAAALAAVTLAYYLFWHAAPVEGEWPAHHVTLPAAAGPNFALAGDVAANALLSEFLPFIMLLFALYTISGGIRFEGDLRPRPATNALFLAAGAVLASLIGTTGAAMVLIRPLLETNSRRRRVAHTVIFFIFIVCNCGGCLLPTGDPPLFLGYLLGVDFFWTLRLWPEWLLVNGALVAIYFLYDALWHYPREREEDVARDAAEVRPLRFLGVWPNAALLVAVVAAVALLDPGGTLPGTSWHPWLFLREAVLLGLVGLSLMLGDRDVRRANQFNYAAILEVAALFFGIFICMQPALQIISVKGPDLGLATPTHFFWSTGVLSSVLDNAPTYVVFFETARTLSAGMLRVPAEPLLVAISLGAVFMGASSYIGNGPNFMVKAIAEKSGVRMPGFFGYMLYSAVILLPLLALSNWIFLR
jgi:Na+/H+ antiporter NhaD/arsenite permease-like protein